MRDEQLTSEYRLHIWSLIVLGLLVCGGVLVGIGGPDERSTPETVSERTDGWAVVESVSGNTTVTVTYIAAGEPQQFEVQGVNPGLSNASAGWALVDRTALPAPLAHEDGNVSAGVVGFGEWALVGALHSTTVEIDTTTLTVVVPAGRAVDPARKAGFIKQFVGPYSLSPQNDRPVIIVSVPDVLPAYGRMYAEGRGYVTRRTFWDGDVHSVWIHEFIHARQHFSLAPEMGWFREASAEYLGYRFMQEQYSAVTDRDVRARLDALRDHDGVVLANRTTWEAVNGQYHEGARLAATIDAAIRVDTNGTHTLVDVFRAMNAVEEPITVERFVSLVEAYTGEDESWIAAAIEGKRPVTERPSE